MGGHAFKLLNCPRISPDVYEKVKSHTTTALQTIFSHVTIPTELPEKDDYGDIDFLVAGPLHSPTSTSIDSFDWPGTVSRIKSVFNTVHGRRGFLTTDCMYFVIRAPDHKDNFWIQVDVKVCFRPELFAWQEYELSYATTSKMKGSMVKPLGLTIDPEGLHIRVEDMDDTNFPGSMIWISKDPKDVLRVMGLDRRILDAAFKSKDEIYEYLVGSWLFNPAHFAARLAQGNYSSRLEDRSPHWTYFIREWIPQHYPNYCVVDDNSQPAENGTDPNQRELELKAWNKRTRAAVREKVLTMFPHIAERYYVTRATYVKELEERRLRTTITDAIPEGGTGWKNDFLHPCIIVKTREADPNTLGIPPTEIGELTPPPSTSSTQPSDPWNVPLFLDTLPRTPPLLCTPHPPPAKMSPEAKLVCLARWTLFDPENGNPYLLSSPRDKDFDMYWTDANYAGATDQVLVDWAKEMWWHVWIRQSHTNYVGMWKKRFERQDQKAGKAREEEEAAKVGREKIVERLKVLNKCLGLVDEHAMVA